MVKLAVIGAGRFGTNILNTFSQMEKQGRCKLVALCDIDPHLLASQSKRYGKKGYLDYKEMLLSEKDVDAVAIATPDPFHREPVLYAANLGKHIFVEKPLDITVEGCQEMIEVCKKNKLLLQVDFHKRFDPFHLAVKKDIEKNKAGTLKYGYAYMEDKIVVPRDWFVSWAAQSSPVWFLGVHFFDLMRWLIGSDGKTVYAKGSKVRLKSLGIDTYDFVSSMIEFKNGVIINFDVSWIFPEKFESIVNQGFKLVGDKGVIECDSQDRGTRVFYEKSGVMTYNPAFIYEESDKSGGIKYLGYGIESIADFVYNLERLRKGGTLNDIKKEITALGEDGLEATKIGVAVHKSLESGKVEEVG
ncbi:Gfo/Idh/MocA family oxidoreductase [bacterium]|nr:Gfo/Idh/MocA family oxidoreductase [bacterium]